MCSKQDHCFKTQLHWLQAVIFLAIIHPHRVVCSVLKQLIVITHLLIHQQQQVVCSVLNQQKNHHQQVAYSELNLLIIHQQQVVSLVLSQQITHLHRWACLVLNQHLKLDYLEPSQLRMVDFLARKLLLLIINLEVCSIQLLQQVASLEQILLEAYSVTQLLQHRVVYSEQIHLERVCLTKIRIYSRSQKLKKTMMKKKRVKRVKNHHPIMPQRTIKLN